MKSILKKLHLVLLLFVFVFGSVVSVFGQKGLQIPKGLTVKNGILYFKDVETLGATYDYLEKKQIEFYKSTLKSDGKEMEEDEFLRDFENEIGLKNSLRKMVDNQAKALYKDAENGKSVSKRYVDTDVKEVVAKEVGVEEFFDDELIMAMMNEHRAIGIGNDIFMPSPTGDFIYYRIVNSNQATYNAIIKGVDPHSKYNKTPLYGLHEVIYVGDGSVFRGGGDGKDKGYKVPPFIDICPWLLNSPHAFFTYTRNNLEVCFRNYSFDLSEGKPIVSYEWDFGDDNTSTEKNPCHTYGCIGNFIVKLKVTDRGGKTASFALPLILNNGGDTECCKAWPRTVKYKYFGSKYRTRTVNKHIQWLIVNKVVAKIKYQKKTWGTWWRKKTNYLGVGLSGRVYHEGDGCSCQVPHDISTALTGAHNVGGYSVRVDAGQFLFRWKMEDPWKANYKKDGTTWTVTTMDPCK